jgi:hypothetical protein
MIRGKNMKNNHSINKSDEILFDLLDKKEFEELNPDEREFVLANLGTKEKFDSLKKTGIISRKSFVNERNSLIPPLNDFSALNDEINTSKEKPIIYRIINFKIPAYQTAAAVILVISAFLLFNKQETQISYVDRVKYVEVPSQLAESSSKEIKNSPDKVIIDKPKVKLINKNTISSGPKNKEIEKKKETINIPQNNRYVGLANLKHLETQKKGVSISEDPSMLRFLFTEGGRK